MHNLAGGAWMDVGDGCPVFCSVSGSNEAYLRIGKPPHQYELNMTVQPMRELVATTTAALAQMELTAQQEAAERDGQQAVVRRPSAERSA